MCLLSHFMCIVFHAHLSVLQAIWSYYLLAGNSTYHYRVIRHTVTMRSVKLIGQCTKVDETMIYNYHDNVYQHDRLVWETLDLISSDITSVKPFFLNTFIKFVLHDVRPLLFTCMIHDEKVLLLCHVVGHLCQHVQVTVSAWIPLCLCESHHTRSTLMQQE